MPEIRDSGREGDERSVISVAGATQIYTHDKMAENCIHTLFQYQFPGSDVVLQLHKYRN